MPLAAHGVSHPGRRPTNEDSMLVDSGRGLFIVADGMGGHNAGEVASELAVRTIGEFLGDVGADGRIHLDQAIKAANEEILATAAGQSDYAGMGTTVVAALFTNEHAYFANVGDSRAYVWRSGGLTRLTRDDSWLSAAMEGAGEASAIEHHPMKHVLTKVVGLRPELQPIVAEFEFRIGDVLLLCTDGVHGAVADTALGDLLGSGKPVAEIADRVVGLAISRGATDNVTAVVVRRE
ncbi:MAG TPA: protein phosphatase 2C domain-containing protein [Vicinamibacterales bacterium]